MGCGGSPKFKSITWPSSPHYGDRTVTITGTVDNPADGLQVEATIGQNRVTASASSGNFSVAVSLANGTNQITVSLAEKEKSYETRTSTVIFPFLSLEKFQEAAFAIGQPNLTTATAGTTANTLRTPFGNPAIADETLFVADTYNHRVLGFSPIPTASNASATFALGQPDLVTAGINGGLGGMAAPNTVVASGGKLFVPQTGTAYTGILVFDPIPTGNGPASFEVGQTNAPYMCTRTNMFAPTGLFVHGDRLFAADSFNNRVLVFDSIPTTSSAIPDWLLGFSDFSHCEQYNVTRTTLIKPSDVWTDGTRLLIADAGNGRVLLWNQIPTGPNVPADVVIGQPDGNTRSGAGTPQADMRSPLYVASNGNQIFVTDASLNRVLVWNSFPTADHQPADLVLGQSDFQCTTANDPTCSGVEASHPFANTLKAPAGLLLTDTQLYVVDRDNNRILVFNGK
jgi:hypothetical protein